jgi:hypothetical protein
MQQILELLGRLFTLESPCMFYSGVWICAAILWVLTVICALTSVWSRPFSRRRKTLWTLLVVGLPLVGLAAYLPFSLGEELLPLLGFWRKPRH